MELIESALEPQVGERHKKTSTPMAVPVINVGFSGARIGSSYSAASLNGTTGQLASFSTKS